MLVSEAYHPYWEHWWPHGHMIGWEDNFVHELLHLLTCIKEDTPVAPRAATMEDGYRCAEICDAIVRSHETGQRQKLEYRIALMASSVRPDRQAGGVTGASQGIGAAAAVALARAGRQRRLRLPQRDRRGGADGRGDPGRRARGARPAG